MAPIWAISPEVETFLDRVFVFGGRFHSHVDAALEVHRVHAGGDGLDALADDGLGQHGGGGGAVACLRTGFAGHLANHLGAHVLEVIGQLDFFGDRHAVLGDARGSV